MIDKDAILEAIDWEPVVAAIRAEPLVHWGYEDAAMMVWNATARFLPSDLETCDFAKAIEQHWALDLRPGREMAVYFGAGADEIVAAHPATTAHGYTDLVLATDDYIGLTYLFDWKTASALDGSWQAALADSWQWRIYCAVYGADNFAYRGIDKSVLEPRTPGKPYDWTRAPLKQVSFTADGGLRAEVINYLATNMAMRDTLAARFPFGRWPRRMPDACWQYRQRCAFWDNCRDAAKDVTDVFMPKPLSHSGITKFLNCPESYRLATVTGHRGGSTATELGKALHRGMAAVYEQFKTLKEKFYETDTARARASAPPVAGGAGHEGGSATDGPDLL
jgi:hypothetical protein